MVQKRTLTAAQKTDVVVRQRCKCANKPTYNLLGNTNTVVPGHLCPLWKKDDGTFDNGKWEIDHIKPLYKGGKDVISNLHALCPSCHRAKTHHDRLLDAGLIDSTSARKSKVHKKQPSKSAQKKPRKVEGKQKTKPLKIKSFGHFIEVMKQNCMELVP